MFLLFQIYCDNQNCIRKPSVALRVLRASVVKLLLLLLLLLFPSQEPLPALPIKRIEISVLRT